MKRLKNIVRVFPQTSILWISLCISFVSTSFAATSSPKAKPKLVVVLSIDQFRADYLTRFENLFLPPIQQSGRPGGFRFLLDRGAYFLNAQMAHAPNVTAVGHAAMLTGAMPYLHGIVANYWYDHVQGERTYCVEDSNVETLGTKFGSHSGRSPHSLLVTTVGDELKNAMGGRPRVVSVAYKDRAAILMGGRRADLAIWYDESSHQWTTSTYYLPQKQLPAWLSEWNKYDYMSQNSPKDWAKLLSDNDYKNSIELPANALGNARGLGKTFPHPIGKNLDAFLTSPWGNAYILDTALKAASHFKLGTNKDVPDLLAVSLSTFDALGHNYGPLSVEMQDTTLRVDRMLASFFDTLSKSVPGGLSNVLIVLTADHGVQPNPVLAETLKLPGGVYEFSEIINKGNAFLRDKFGFKNEDKPLVNVFEDNIYLDHALIEKRGKDLTDVARKTATWIRSERFVAEAFARDDLIQGHIPPTDIARKLANSTHPVRSGDVVYSARPGYLAMDSHGYGGTEHESATVLDAKIPLVFAGLGIKAGRYFDAVYLNDLAPTLSAILGISPPSGSEGRVLTQVLSCDGRAASITCR